MSWNMARYIWTACGAGWFVLYLLTQSIPAMLVCVGCLAVAGLMTIIEECLK
jgi:hypothetical protein